jgi:hypothetical protein
MSINKKIQNYQFFFSDQVREAEMEQKSIIKAPMNQLFRKEEIIIGYVDHINDKLGHVILKFPKDKAPRLKVQKSIMVIKKDAKAELERIKQEEAEALERQQELNKVDVFGGGE